MIYLLIFIICSISITNIFIHEYVFDWLHRLIDEKLDNSLIQKFTNCSVCSSFYIGALLSILFPPLFPLWYNWFLMGLIASICMKTWELKINR